MHDFPCGLKTVPVKRTFLNIAIVGWGGVGWGGMLTFFCTSYMIYCHAAEISGIVYYVTCCYAAEISGIVYYVTCSMWNLMKKSIPSNLSAKSDLLMVYARAWQWRCIHKNAEKQKKAPLFFFPSEDFQSSNQHGTVVKSQLKNKKRAFMYVLWARFPVRRDVFAYGSWVPAELRRNHMFSFASPSQFKRTTVLKARGQTRQPS